jgi:hypothetical protein
MDVTVAQPGPRSDRCSYPGAMTWTAPDVVREPGPWTGGERVLLEWFLDFRPATTIGEDYVVAAHLLVDLIIMFVDPRARAREATR